MPRFRLAHPASSNWMVAVLSRLSSLPRFASLTSGPRTSALLDSVAPAHRPLRVLLVEDNLVNQLIASEVMARCGVTPKFAVNGLEAVAIACSHEFDLIVMDIQMPLMDGLGATRQIRQFELACSRQRTPVVAYTTGSLCNDKALLDECGFDDVLDKPCNEEAFRTCLERWSPSPELAIARRNRCASTR